MRSYPPLRVASAERPSPNGDLVSRQSSPARHTASMPSLRSGADRCTLRPGKNTLGGRGAEALPIAPLAWHPPVETITVPEHGPVLIQRITAAVVVRLDDQPLGVAPAELRHGAHIDLVGCRLTYEADVPASESVSVSPGLPPMGATPIPRNTASPLNGVAE